MNRNTQFALLGLLGVLVAGCNTDMWQQPKTGPFGESEFYGDGRSARALVPGTVARGHLRTDETFFTGYVKADTPSGKKLADTIPIPVTKELIARGKERFMIYCTPCHGQLGDGNGMISKRGFKVQRPVASYHTDRLRKMPVGHFYDVITNGYGAMFSYASRVEPQDRWAIASYIRVLQLSQQFPKSALTAEDQAKMVAQDKPGKEEEGH